MRVRCPEFHIAGSCTAAVPQAERLRHVPRGFVDLLAVDGVDNRHFVRRKLAPPSCQLEKTPLDRLALLRMIVGRRRTPDPRIKAKQLFDQVNQLINTVIVNTILQRWEQAELGVKSQNIPRVNNRAALNSAVNQRNNLIGCGDGLVQTAVINMPIPRSQPAIDLTEHPRRCRRHDRSLLAGAVGVAHAGKYLGQMDVLQLARSMLCQPGVQMFSGTTKWLVILLGVALQLQTNGRWRTAYQASIELVAISRDKRQQRDQRDARIIRSRAATTDSRRHQHRTGQHSRSLEHQQVNQLRPSRLHALSQSIQRHLLQHEPAVATLLVDLVWVPLSKMMVGAFVHRMVKIISARVKRKLIQ